MFNRRIFHCLRVQVLIISAIAVAGCGGDGLEGTYHGPEGAVVLELKGGNTATVTFMGDTDSCTYESTKEQITLACPGAQGLGGSILGTLRRNQDGTLASDVGVLAKRTTS